MPCPIWLRQLMPKRKKNSNYFYEECKRTGDSKRTFPCLSLLTLPEFLEHKFFVVVGIHRLGIKAKSLIIGSQSLLIALESKKLKSLVAVGFHKLGIKAKSLLIALEFPEHISPSVIGSHRLGIKAKSLIIGSQGFLV